LTRLLRLHHLCVCICTPGKTRRRTKSLPPYLPRPDSLPGLLYNVVRCWSVDCRNHTDTDTDTGEYAIDCPDALRLEMRHLHPARQGVPAPPLGFTAPLDDPALNCVGSCSPDRGKKEKKKTRAWAWVQRVSCACMHACTTIDRRITDPKPCPGCILLVASFDHTTHMHKATAHHAHTSTDFTRLKPIRHTRHIHTLEKK
jgi:hypothetical protein